jgi:gluconokinase
MSCFGHSLIPLDQDGRPLTPLLGWRDTRSQPAVEWLERRLDPVAVHARTGCHIHPSYWLAKLAWLGQDEPGVARKAERYVSIGEYLALRLHRAEPRMSLSTASTTGLFDLAESAWDEELLAVLGIDAARLPEISEDPVDGNWYPAWFDGSCSNLGAGCVGRDRAALMVGTSAALRIVYETEQPQPQAGLFLYRVDERRVVEGGALSDGGNVYAWIERTLAQSDGSLADRDPDSHGLTFLALLGGERSTGWDASRTGAIAGLTFDTTPLDLRQAALEGVGFRFAEVADLLPEVVHVVATGGALEHDEEWTQIMADTLGRPVEASPVKEASLRGAAVRALERLGIQPPVPPAGRVFAPRGDRAEAYRSARDRQRRLYDATREWP